MSLLRRRSPTTIRGIRKKTLDMILESSRSSHPNEFGALLRAQDGVITELILLPGTVSGQSHAIFQLHMLPIDYSIVGSVHSHPSESNFPSEADLGFFRRSGVVHIIVCAPYTINDWAAYDINGESTTLEIV